jgi:hypothetical protein
MQRCLITNCVRFPFSRGLCSACYTAARVAVKSGKTTWLDLETRGLAKVKAKRGRKHGAFVRAFQDEFKSV